MLPDRSDAGVLIADKGYDSDWFREALSGLAITPCIPGRANRKTPIPYAIFVKRPGPDDPGSD